MTYPRSHLVDPEGGCYHVCSRCVRRAFLCGTDQLTGFNFDHRKQWIEGRVLALSEIFAVDLYGYAVMSNHYHIVLNLDPKRVLSWRDEEVVDRWLALMPQSGTDADKLLQLRKQALLDDEDRLSLLRERLGSLSWFMRYLNEPLARLANAEDNCKGRFWEGRFKSQRLLDDNSVLACMVYVDLNPVRAGLANDIAEAEHTSLARRIAKCQETGPMTALNRPGSALPFEYSLEDYIDLARWTAAAQQSVRPGSSTCGPPHISQDLWLQHYLPKPNHWQRALGSLQHLKDYAAEIGQCWIKTGSSQALT